jgi:hypothetical protein
VALRVSATKQVIQTNGLASSSTPITRVRGAQIVMPQSFHPLNTEEERTLLARGKRLLNHKLLGHQILVFQEYMCTLGKHTVFQ